MFGIRILTRCKMQKIKDEIRTETYRQAIADILALLNKKDKIILEPMTIEGPSTFSDCVFIGSNNAVTIE